jgi:hypothetical protein
MGVDLPSLRERSDQAIHGFLLLRRVWIASRSLSSGARSRDPLARNDGESAVQLQDMTAPC